MSAGVAGEERRREVAKEMRWERGRGSCKDGQEWEELGGEGKSVESKNVIKGGKWRRKRR